MALRILYEDPYMLAVEKPAGFHSHSPESGDHKIPRALNTLLIARDQTQTYLYPLHRLDRATSGVLAFAKSKEIASSVNQMWREGKVEKKYITVCRGWLKNNDGVFDKDLTHESDINQTLKSVTHYQTISQLEISERIGRYPTSRYSLLFAQPKTGRLHQIRRHFKSASHPLIGDSVYGDGIHNRFFKDHLGIPPLLLKAYSLSFIHPKTNKTLLIHSRWNGTWIKCFDLFGICPFF
jgi:tRNA pseudouridine65 synthase